MQRVGDRRPHRRRLRDGRRCQARDDSRQRATSAGWSNASPLDSAAVPRPPFWLAVEVDVDAAASFVKLSDEVLQGEPGEVPVVVVMNVRQGIGDLLDLHRRRLELLGEDHDEPPRRGFIAGML